MPLNLEKYHHYLANYDMSETQKTKLMEAVGLIVENIADNAFGLNSIHQISETKTQQICSDSSGGINSYQLQQFNESSVNDNQKSLENFNRTAKARL